MAFEQALDRSSEGVVGRSEEIDAILRALGQREQLLHEVDAGNPLGQWIAKKTRGPDH